MPGKKGKNKAARTFRSTFDFDQGDPIEFTLIKAFKKENNQEEVSRLLNSLLDIYSSPNDKMHISNIIQKSLEDLLGGQGKITDKDQIEYLEIILKFTEENKVKFDFHPIFKKALLLDPTNKKIIKLLLNTKKGEQDVKEFKVINYFEKELLKIDVNNLTELPIALEALRSYGHGDQLLKLGIDTILDEAKHKPEKYQGKLINMLLKNNFLPEQNCKVLLAELKKIEEGGVDQKLNIISLEQYILEQEETFAAKQQAKLRLNALPLHDDNEKRSFGFVSRFVLAAQGAFESKESNKILREKVLNAIDNNRNPNLSFYPLRVESGIPGVKASEKAELDTIEIRNRKADPPNGKYIINFEGNNAAYENAMEAMIKEASDLNCNVIGFNYRGVAQSKGDPSSKDKLVEDGIAQVERLLKLGVPPANITLKGHSIGAGIATLVAKHFADKGQKLFLFSGRSFDTLVAAVIGTIKSYLSTIPVIGNLLGRFAAWIAKPIIKAVLKANFDLDSTTAYRALDNDHKEHLVVKATKKVKSIGKEALKKGIIKEEINYSDDDIIVPAASLHKAIKHDRQQFKKEFQEKTGMKMPKYNKVTLAKLPTFSWGLSHNVELRYLRNEDHIAGNEIFANFFKQQGKSKVEQIQHLYKERGIPLERIGPTAKLSAEVIETSRTSNTSNQSEALLSLGKNQEKLDAAPLVSFSEGHTINDKSPSIREIAKKEPLIATAEPLDTTATVEPKKNDNSRQQP